MLHVTIYIMETGCRQEIAEEDQLVAELHQLGITYLSNRLTKPPRQLRSPEQLLADTVRQPSGRVRTAVIALFLLHPEFAKAVPAALDLLQNEQRQVIELFYMAAVYLQRQYKDDLLPIVGSDWDWLSDQYDQELGIPSDLSPQESIRQLGVKHQQLTRTMTNWAGTYENVVHHLIRYKQREMQWNQLPPKR